MKLSKNNKWIWIGFATLVLGGVWLLSNRHYVPKNSDEFFRRNPHLQRPISRMALEPDQLREGDQFKDGDYQLLANHVYPVEFSESIQLTQADQPMQEFETRGKVLLKSLGLIKGRLVVLAEFEFANTKELKKLKPAALEEFGILTNEKQKPSRDQILKRTLLVKLDPRGKVRELYTSSPKILRSSIEPRLKVLDQIFKKVSVYRPGMTTVTEVDEVGYPYKMNYEVTDGGLSLRIKAKSSQDYGMNQSESKAAAAGAQGMGLMSIQGKQEASMDWLWIKSEQRPLQQNSIGTSELRLRNQLIAQTAGSTKISWGETSTDSTIESTATNFTHPINVQLIRALSRKNQNKTLNQGTQAKAPSDKKAKQEKLTEKEMHHQAFDKLADDLKENPQKIESFKKMAMSAQPGSEGLSMVLGSLGYEGSEESQKALVEIYARNDLTDRDRGKIMTELTLADQALSPEVKKFLKTEFEKQDYVNSRIAKQAGLALGASISKDGDPDTIQYLHDQWDEAASKSKDAQEKRGRQKYLLTVMGNSKSDVFMSEANKVSGSSDPTLRAAAADSVRFSQSDDSRNLLFGLLSDENPEVRTLVVQALRYQPFDDRTKSALQSCTSDADTGVKLNCYRMLTYNINQPGIREYLAGRASSESDVQVKRTLTEALSMENDARK